MNYNVQLQNPELGEKITKNFVHDWMAGGELRKKAEYGVNSYVRDKLRENGIVRSQILPAIELADGQLDRDMDPKVLRKFMEIEPDSTATWVPFRGKPNLSFVQGRFAPVYFGKIESELHGVNIYELKNYNNDLRKILNDQDIKNLQEREDESFINQCIAIVEANAAEQDKQFFGGLSKVNWYNAKQAFPINRPVKFALMNSHTAQEFGKWNYSTDIGYGGTSGNDLYRTGETTMVGGIQIIQTIKDWLIPDGVVWMFAPEEFIGKFFTLEEPTTYVEQKRDWLYFCTMEVIGIGIANTKSFIRCTFNP